MASTAPARRRGRRKKLADDQWADSSQPPPFAFVAGAENTHDRVYLLGAYESDFDNPTNYADDMLFIMSGSCVPTLYYQDGSNHSTAKLVGNLALAEAPIDVIVSVLQQKRREEGKARDAVCAEFITAEMVEYEFAYQLKVFPYEAQAEVAASVLLQARLGNNKALELMVANKMPWTTQSGAPISAKQPWQVSGTLRIERDQNIHNAHADNEGEGEPSGPPKPEDLKR